MDRYKFFLGLLLVIGLMALATAVALGKVEEKTSYGLVPILGIVGKMALDFSEWAFRTYRKDEKEEPAKSEDQPKT